MVNSKNPQLDQEVESKFLLRQAELIKLLLSRDPIMGTQLGIAGLHDDLLTPVNVEHRNSLMIGIKESVQKFEKDASPNLNYDDDIDLELAISGVRGLDIMESALNPIERNPDWYLDNALTGLYSILMRSDMSIDERFEHIKSRLCQIPGILEAARIQIGRPLRILVETAAGNVDGALSFCRDSLGDFIASVPNQMAKNELETARNSSLEALDNFKGFIETLYERSTDDFAIGRSTFNMLLKETHRIPYDSEQLLEIGNRVVGDLEESLSELSLETTGQSKWWESLKPLSMTHPAAGDLLDEYNATLEDARKFVEDRNLVNTSEITPLELQPTPAFARANLPFAAYIPKPQFVEGGSSKFWVTPVDGNQSENSIETGLRQHHAGRILVACVHEGYPGHHVQFSHARKVRRPLRHIFTSTVFVEGWALYCEELMRREGYKKSDPNFALLQLSQLRDQLWRALRIVIDVGLHCNGMTPDEAVSLLVDKHVLGKNSAEAEVMYYCSAPTQPMSYMVGKILLEDLIARCRSSAEDRFKSLSSIHNEILACGALPFPLLQRAIRV